MRKPAPAPVAAPPPRSDRPLLLLVAALVGLLLFAPQVVAMVGRDTTAADTHESSGYNRIIKLFGRKGWLIAHRGDPDPDQPVVTLSRRMKSRLDDFTRNSYLRADLEANDPGLWQFSGERRVVGIDPSAHSVIGPFARTRVWKGDILFRDKATTEVALVSTTGGQRLVFIPRARGWSPGAPPPPSVTVAPFAPAAASATPPAAVKGGDFAFQDQTGAVLAYALLVGDQVVIKVQDGAPPGSEVLVGPEALRPDTESVAFRALEPNQKLQLVLPGGRTAEFTLEVASADLSAYRSPTSRQRADSAKPLALNIEAAMGRLTQFDPNRWGRQSVATTLDRGLQDEAQGLLRASSLDLRAQLPAKRTFRSAALVMDGLTGEVLAAASFPADASDLTDEERNATASASLIERNHNFTRLNIGSVAKIPFSLAIIDTTPALASLSIRGSGGADAFRTILGQDLESELPEESSADPVGLAAFIRTSSNRFASSLMLLASAPDPLRLGQTPAGPGYELNGGHRDFLPEGAFWTVHGPDGQVHLVRGGRSATVQMAWVRQMGSFFDLPHLGDVGSRDDAYRPSRNDVYDMGLWKGLIGSGEGAAARGFLAVSPERESFAMTLIQSLRNDYLQLILGGGRSRWTTVKVAETFSRIVTGRQVEARFIRPAEAVMPDPMPFNPSPDAAAARQSLLAAMQTVWTDGTASLLSERLRHLQAMAPPGEEVRIYAKTGTPTLEHPRSSIANRVVNALMELRIVRVDDFSRRVSVLGARSAGLGDMARALRDNPDSRQIMSRYRIRSEAVAAYVQSLNGGRRAILAQDGEEGFFVAPDLEPERGDGGVLALTIARYRIGQAQPIRVLTIVVNVQAKLPKGAANRVNPATGLIRDWLQKPRLAELLFAPAAAPSAGRLS